MRSDGHLTVVAGVDEPVGCDGERRVGRSERQPQEVLVSESTGQWSRTVDGIDTAILAVRVNHLVGVDGRGVDTPLEAIVVVYIGTRVLELPLRRQGRRRELSHVVGALGRRWAEGLVVAV